VAAHLAASSVAHCLAEAEAEAAAEAASPSGAAAGAGASAAPAAAVLQLFAERALDGLEAHWPKLTPQNVQGLFRSPGDSTELARHVLTRIDRLQDPHSQIAALNGAAVALPGEELSAARAALRRRLTEGPAGAAELCAAEAALRRGPRPVAGSREEASHMELLAGLREQTFQATLQAEATWCQRPARGYMRYVEECLRRSRGELPVGLQRPAVPAPATAAEAPVAEEPSKEPAVALRKPQTAVQVASPQERGVSWHPGVEGWEVRLELQGRRVLAGYFVPQDSTTEEVERARVAAVAHRTALEQQHTRRPAP